MPVTEMERYVLEEWAEDYRAGRLARRELLRRLALMAGGAALAVPMLQHLGIVAAPEEVAEAAGAPPAAAAAAPGVTVAPNDLAIEAVGTINFPAGTGMGIGYVAKPRGGGPFPGVLIIHENRGLLEHFKDIARRLAQVGYVGLAVDLASHQGGTEHFSDPAQVTAILAQTPVEQHLATMNAAVRHLQGLPYVRRDHVGATGFCFGGGMVWRLATANADLRAAVPFYGPNPPLGDVPKIRAAVLGIYGELDSRINTGIPALREALQRAGITHEIVVYPGADHAFFNDTGPRYHAVAARQAWERLLGWFDRYLRA
ncbi:MAG: dienelactone hydrolase family protein [Armatimonadota bacterium]|nr:dienelactone hydrolase family protein [Armatimonadota bacterium]